MAPEWEGTPNLLKQELLTGDRPVLLRVSEVEPGERARDREDEAECGQSALAAGLGDLDAPVDADEDVHDWKQEEDEHPALHACGLEQRDEGKHGQPDQEPRLRPRLLADQSSGITKEEVEDGECHKEDGEITMAD